MIASAIKHAPNFYEYKSDFKRNTADIYVLNEYLREEISDPTKALMLLKYEFVHKCRYSFIQRIYARFITLIREEDRKELDTLYETMRKK